MKKFKLVCLFALCLCAQATILSRINLFGVKPDFFLVTVALAAIFFPTREALIFALCCGCLKDILGIQSFGIHTVFFVFWTLVIRQLVKRFSFENAFFASGLFFLILAVNGIVARFALASAGIDVALGISVRIIILSACLSTVVFYYLFQYTYKLLYR